MNSTTHGNARCTVPGNCIRFRFSSVSLWNDVYRAGVVIKLASLCSAAIPCGPQFQSQVLHLQFSSLLKSLRKQWKMTQDDPAPKPGRSSGLQPSLTPLSQTPGQGDSGGRSFPRNPAFHINSSTLMKRNLKSHVSHSLATIPLRTR